MFGQARGFGSIINVSALDGDNGFRLDGFAPRGFSGGSVASAGDINNDGFDDIIIGASRADSNGTDSGSSYVIFGHRALASVTRIGTDIAQAINGGRGDDRISALGGDDKLIGWEGQDTMAGGDGNDTLNGGSGSDRMAGGAGDDVFIVSLGQDVAIGNLGFDRLDFSQLPGRAGICVDLAANTAILPSTIGSLVFSSIEWLTGDSGADSFIGNGAANRLDGLIGADTLSGGGGNDTIAGGRNGDFLTGGGGSDIFDFDSIIDSSVGFVNRDIITDFNSNNADVIDLSTIDANADGGSANDTFAFKGTANFDDLGQIRVAQIDGNTFIAINTTGTLAPDMHIQLTGLVTLDEADFLL
jgi:Ca2+-binding RTX toxin-like protein